MCAYTHYVADTIFCGFIEKMMQAEMIKDREQNREQRKQR